MDIISMARELGKALQQEETYINWKNTQQTADADAELQKLIGEFNLKRMIINDEAGKQDRDQEKLTQANKEMRAVYSQIMSNENMIAYNDAKAAFDAVLNRVTAIIQQSAQGVRCGQRADIVARAVGGKGQPLDGFSRLGAHADEHRADGAVVRAAARAGKACG